MQRLSIDNADARYPVRDLLPGHVPLPVLHHNRFGVADAAQGMLFDRVLSNLSTNFQLTVPCSVPTALQPLRGNGNGSTLEIGTQYEYCYRLAENVWLRERLQSADQCETVPRTVAEHAPEVQPLRQQCHQESPQRQPVPALADATGESSGASLTRWHRN